MTDAEYDRILDEVAGERVDNLDTTPDPKTTETAVGRTPSGGDYSVAYFYDKDGNPCPKRKAVRMNIVEYTNDGVRVNEAYGFLGK